MVKERPILFSAPMVLAILDGRKTQTRRIVKPQPNVVHAIHTDASIETNLIFRRGDQRIHCPYGKPGDRLWVRETWALSGRFANAKVSDYQIPEVTFAENLVHFADADAYDVSTQSWRASIHMPRWASRINLEVTGIRVERLQDISEDDARAEGVPGNEEAAALGCDWYEKPRRAYRRIWSQINGEASWDKNPWVWVTEFKRIKS
jgi:hypothetical protein